MKSIILAFPGGKNKTLTMSYDDGMLDDIRLIDIFNKYGIKGTFHLNSGNLGVNKYGNRIAIDKIKEIYKGHEVACHTVNHVSLDKVPLTGALEEIVENRKALEGQVKYPVTGMSYPYGDYNEEVINILKSAGIEYSRTVDITGDFSLPKDFYKWRGTCRHEDKNLFNYVEEFLRLNRKDKLYMFYLWGHSYEFTLNDNWHIIEKCCEKLGKKEDIWYATNIEIVNYIKAYNNLKFSMDGTFVYNPSAISVWIRVDGVLYEILSGEIKNI